MMIAAGGRATDCGVMNRGACFGGSATAVALVVVLADGRLAVLDGRCVTADGGATVGRIGAFGGAAGRAGAAG